MIVIKKAVIKSMAQNDRSEGRFDGCAVSVAFERFVTNDRAFLDPLANRVPPKVNNIHHIQSPIMPVSPLA